MMMMMMMIMIIIIIIIIITRVVAEESHSLCGGRATLALWRKSHRFALFLLCHFNDIITEIGQKMLSNMSRVHLS
jgi:hypothetical protein